jgi:hypothetical protein
MEHPMNYRVVSVLAFLTVFLGACASSGQKTPPRVEGECQVDGAEAAEWVCGAYSEPNRYVAVGSAVKSKLGYDFTRKEALTNARAELIAQINTSVETKIESYRRSTALKDSAERVVSVVSREVSQQVLNNSQQISYWEDVEHNTIYVLVAVDKNSVNQRIDAALQQAAAPSN